MSEYLVAVEPDKLKLDCTYQQAERDKRGKIVYGLLTYNGKNEDNEYEFRTFSDSIETFTAKDLAYNPMYTFSSSKSKQIAALSELRKQELGEFDPTPLIQQAMAFKYKKKPLRQSIQDIEKETVLVGQENGQPLYMTLFKANIHNQDYLLAIRFVENDVALSGDIQSANVYNFNRYEFGMYFDTDENAALNDSDEILTPAKISRIFYGKQGDAADKGNKDKVYYVDNKKCVCTGVEAFDKKARTGIVHFKEVKRKRKATSDESQPNDKKEGIIDVTFSHILAFNNVHTKSRVQGKLAANSVFDHIYRYAVDEQYKKQTLDKLVKDNIAQVKYRLWVAENNAEEKTIVDLSNSKGYFDVPKEYKVVRSKLSKLSDLNNPNSALNKYYSAYGPLYYVGAYQLKKTAEGRTLQYKPDVVSGGKYEKAAKTLPELLAELFAQGDIDAAKALLEQDTVYVFNNIARVTPDGNALRYYTFKDFTNGVVQKERLVKDARYTFVHNGTLTVGKFTGKISARPLYKVDAAREDELKEFAQELHNLNLQEVAAENDAFINDLTDAYDTTVAIFQEDGTAQELLLPIKEILAGNYLPVAEDTTVDDVREDIKQQADVRTILTRKSPKVTEQMAKEKDAAAISNRVAYTSLVENEYYMSDSGLIYLNHIGVDENKHRCYYVTRVADGYDFSYNFYTMTNGALCYKITPGEAYKDTTTGEYITYQGEVHQQILKKKKEDTPAESVPVVRYVFMNAQNKQVVYSFEAIRDGAIKIKDTRKGRK